MILHKSIAGALTGCCIALCVLAVAAVFQCSPPAAPAGEESPAAANGRALDAAGRQLSTASGGVLLGAVVALMGLAS